MSHVTDHLPLAGKVIGETVALGAIAGTFMDWLPAMAAGLAVVWHLLLIYDWVKGKMDNEKRE